MSFWAFGFPAAERQGRRDMVRPGGPVEGTGKPPATSPLYLGPDSMCPGTSPSTCRQCKRGSQTKPPQRLSLLIMKSTTSAMAFRAPCPLYLSTAELSPPGNGLLANPDAPKHGLTSGLCTCCFPWKAYPSIPT